MKRALLILILVVFALPAIAFAEGDGAIRESVRLLGKNVGKYWGFGAVSSVCLEGHVFIVGYAGGLGEGTGVSMAVTQVYHDAGGRIVPMPCSEVESNHAAEEDVNALDNGNVELQKKP